MKISRRTFLAMGGTLSLAGIFLPPWKWFEKAKKRKVFPGILGGSSFLLGHQLREKKFSEPVSASTVGIAIIGGGISGLSAGLRLQKAGYDNFKILEMEKEAGGNAAWGENEVSAYPWGAHYVSLPGSDATLTRQLFEELGIITGYDQKKSPHYAEEYLCADPQERLYIHGQWQEGLVPHIGLSDHEKREIDDFFSVIDDFRKARGKDDRRAFTIPLAFSSRDPEFLSLDDLTMASWMRGKGWRTEPLFWYVDYCCRDDFGASLEVVSAWAGIHYFASRPSHHDGGDELATWPEGNGWIVKKLKKNLEPHIFSKHLAYRVENNSKGVSVCFFDSKEEKTKKIEASAVIYSAPRFTAYHTIPELKIQAISEKDKFTYAPWMVANITLAQKPSGFGAPLAWDNVFYKGKSLGYVVSTHQTLSFPSHKTVLTYYYPLIHTDPQKAREESIKKSHEEWCRLIMEELESVHPGLEKEVLSVDVWLWGHGMIRPIPGFIKPTLEKKNTTKLGNIFFGHSDMSGISIFEEAQYQGVRAAEEALSLLKVSFKSVIG